MKNYLMPALMLAIFETIAVTLWLTKDNLFYLFNFSYIGLSISLGMFLYIRKHRHARCVVQLQNGVPLQITAKTGIIKYKKLKKGKYSVQVNVTAQGNNNYKELPATTVTFKVRVK